MDILQGLNDKQKDAVMTIDGNIRVTAGAGSGKDPCTCSPLCFPRK